MCVCVCVCACASKTFQGSSNTRAGMGLECGCDFLAVVVFACGTPGPSSWRPSSAHPRSTASAGRRSVDGFESFLRSSLEVSVGDQCLRVTQEAAKIAAGVVLATPEAGLPFTRSLSFNFSCQVFAPLMLCSRTPTEALLKFDRKLWPVSLLPLPIFCCGTPVNTLILVRASPAALTHVFCKHKRYR